jgi:hypothetical protein
VAAVVLFLVLAPAAYEPGGCGTLGRSSVAGTGPWHSEQEPDHGGARMDRIRLVCAHGGTMDVRLRPGDHNIVSGTNGYRAEVYGRYGPSGAAPAAEWPDPPGATRRYTVPVYVPANHPVDASGRLWGPIFTQLKGRYGGSPVRSLAFKRDRFYSDSSIGGRFDLGPIARGAWTTFAITETLSPDPRVGGVQIARDGRIVVPWRHVATMETYTNAGCGCRRIDPVYLKVGLYADARWDEPFDLAFGDVTVKAVAPPS